MRTDDLDENSYLEILQNISRTLGCRREEIRDFRPGPSGMMNRSYCFRVGEGEYLYRRPGPGTNALVNRAHEKQSLRLAGELGLDPTCLYMDGRQGWKISRYVPEFREPDYGSEGQVGTEANNYLLYKPDDSTIFEITIECESMGMTRAVKAKAYLKDKDVRYVEWEEDPVGDRKESK